MTIFAIDLGKSKSVFCRFDSTSGATQFGSFPTREDELRKRLDRERPDRVVAEICPQAAMVYDVCGALQIEVQIADTTQDAWQWRNVKRKTDKDDALKLARLSALDQINCVHIPSPQMRQWRRLVEQRITLATERTRCKNRIRALLATRGLSLPRGKSGFSAHSLAALAERARPLSECALLDSWCGSLRIELDQFELFTRQIEQLETVLDALVNRDRRTVLVDSIPGVGPRTAEAIVTALDAAGRFKNSRQVAAYAGLTPRRYQSGAMDRQGRISKRGNPYLRRALNQAAWSAVRSNTYFRAVFLQISGGRKSRRKQAIVAVMRKMLVMAWAILRDGQAYQPRPAPSETAA